MEGMKHCPYCDEEIRGEAIRCRYCRSRLTSFDAGRWHRSHADGRLAGVCAALGSALAVPVAAVRLAFVVFSFFHLIGPLVYGMLWLIIPKRPGEDSLLERTLWRVLDLAATLSGRHNRPPTPPSAWEHPAA